MQSAPRSAIWQLQAARSWTQVTGTFPVAFLQPRPTYLEATAPSTKASARTCGLVIVGCTQGLLVPLQSISARQGLTILGICPYFYLCACPGSDACSLPLAADVTGAASKGCTCTAAWQC